MTLRRRTLVREINPHLICVLCSGYFIEATTIVECLHSFCRSCLIKYLEKNKFCPICDVQLHKNNPLLSVRCDSTLQQLVYKLIPGLYGREMARRRKYYSELGGPSSDPDCGEFPVGDAYFSPEDSISLSLEFISSLKEEESSGSDTEEGTGDKQGIHHRRYLQCPAAVTMSHLKKFLRMKYGLSHDHNVDIIYSGEVLRDDFSLMDVAYTFAWNRASPMRFKFRLLQKNSLTQVVPSKDLVVVRDSSLVPSSKDDSEIKKEMRSPASNAHLKRYFSEGSETKVESYKPKKNNPENTNGHLKRTHEKDSEQPETKKIKIIEPIDKDEKISKREKERVFEEKLKKEKERQEEKLRREKEKYEEKMLRREKEKQEEKLRKEREKAEERARKEEEKARKEEERLRKEEEKTRREEEKARREEEKTKREEEKARREEEKARREEEKTRKEEEKTRKEEEKARREAEKARKEEEKALKDKEKSLKKERNRLSCYEFKIKHKDRNYMDDIEQDIEEDVEEVMEIDDDEGRLHITTPEEDMVEEEIDEEPPKEVRYSKSEERRKEKRRNKKAKHHHHHRHHDRKRDSPPAATILHSSENDIMKLKIKLTDANRPLYSVVDINEEKKEIKENGHKHDKHEKYEQKHKDEEAKKVIDAVNNNKIDIKTKNEVNKEKVVPIRPLKQKISSPPSPKINAPPKPSVSPKICPSPKPQIPKQNGAKPEIKMPPSSITVSKITAAEKRQMEQQKLLMQRNNNNGVDSKRPSLEIMLVNAPKKGDSEAKPIEVKKVIRPTPPSIPLSRLGKNVGFGPKSSPPPLVPATKTSHDDNGALDLSGKSSRKSPDVESAMRNLVTLSDTAVQVRNMMSQESPLKIPVPPALSLNNKVPGMQLYQNQRSIKPVPNQNVRQIPNPSALMFRQHNMNGRTLPPPGVPINSLRKMESMTKNIEKVAAGLSVKAAVEAGYAIK